MSENSRRAVRQDRCVRQGMVVCGVVAAAALALIAPGTAGAACSNETLRAELGQTLLPDCRAWEQVTPVYKEGYGLQTVAYSRDGQVLLVNGIAALAGAGGPGESIEGIGYELARTSVGWHIEALNPPAAVYPSQRLVTGNADTGATLWEMHSASQSRFERELFTRSRAPAGTPAAWSVIGPMFSPAETGGESAITAAFGNKTVAVTADERHVVVESRKELDEAGHRLRWPFDTTIGDTRSLYEYAGVGNLVPTLVGLTGARGSTHLVGRCGIALGSSELGAGGSVYNALSANGETVFVTPLPADIAGDKCAGGAEQPAVAEVYARIGGAATSTRTPETLQVSARATGAECTGPCSTSVAADKLFEGASEDGTKAVFASTQALVNGASEDTTPGDGALRVESNKGCAETTGPGGCNLYEYDLAHHHLSLIAGGAEVLGLARIAPDGSHVYFVAKAALAGTGEPKATREKAQTAPTAGEPNLYVYDAATAATRFIATLNPAEDSRDWQEADSRPVQASAGEGRYLIFPSAGVKLTTDDTGTKTQLFEYDAQTGELVRVSKGEVTPGEAAEVAKGEKAGVGYSENGNAVAGVYPAHLFQSYVNEDIHQLESGDTTFVTPTGSTVMFDSRGQLSPRAASAERECLSVYEYHVGGGGAGITGGAVSLLSDGRDVQPYKGVSPPCYGAALEEMDKTGENVLFSTADPLSSGDADGLQRDVYDARVGGGFPPVTTPAECQLEACHGGLMPAPGLLVGHSAAQGPEPPPPAAVRAAIQILARSHRRGGATVRLRVSAAGTVSLSARGLRPVTRRVPAAGVYAFTLRFTSDFARRLRPAQKRTLTLVVAYHPASGGPGQLSKTSLNVRG
jgi:hypothetical protein